MTDLKNSPPEHVLKQINEFTLGLLRAAEDFYNVDSDWTNTPLLSSLRQGVKKLLCHKEKLVEGIEDVGVVASLSGIAAIYPEEAKKWHNMIPAKMLSEKGNICHLYCMLIEGFLSAMDLEERIQCSIVANVSQVELYMQTIPEFATLMRKALIAYTIAKTFLSN